VFIQTAACSPAQLADTAACTACSCQSGQLNQHVRGQRISAMLQPCSAYRSSFEERTSAVTCGDVLQTTLEASSGCVTQITQRWLVQDTHALPCHACLASFRTGQAVCSDALRLSS